MFLYFALGFFSDWIVYKLHFNTVSKWDSMDSKPKYHEGIDFVSVVIKTKRKL